MKRKRLFLGLILFSLIAIGGYRSLVSKRKHLVKTPQVFTLSRLGYIKKISEENGKKYLELDEIQLLTQDKTTCLAEEDEREIEEEYKVPQCNPKGFLIINESQGINKFQIAEKALESDEDIDFENPYSVEEAGGIINKITKISLPY